MEGMFNYVPTSNIALDLGESISASKESTIYDSMFKLISKGTEIYKDTVGKEKQLEDHIKGLQYGNEYTADLYTLGDASTLEKANRVNVKLMELKQQKDEGVISDSFYKASVERLIETQMNLYKAAKTEIKFNSAKAIIDLGGSAMEYEPAVNDKGEAVDGLSKELRTYLQKVAVQKHRLEILDNPRYTIEAERNLTKLREELNSLSDMDKEIANGYFSAVTTLYSEKYKDLTKLTSLVGSTIATTLSDSRNTHAITDANKTLEVFRKQIEDLPESDIKTTMVKEYLDSKRMINNELERRTKEAEAKARLARMEALQKQQIAEQNVYYQKVNLLTKAIKDGNLDRVYEISKEDPKIVKDYFNNIVHSIYTDNSGGAYNSVKTLINKINTSNNKAMLRLISKEDLKAFNELDTLVKIYGNDPKIGFQGAYSKFVLNTQPTNEVKAEALKAVKDYKESPYYDTIQETVTNLIAKGVSKDIAVRSVLSNLPNGGKATEIDGVKAYADIDKYDIYFLKKTLPQIKDWKNVTIKQEGDLLFFSANGLPIGTPQSYSVLKQHTNTPEFVEQYGEDLLKPVSSKSLFGSSVDRPISSSDAQLLLKQKPYLKDKGVYKDSRGQYWVKTMTKEEDIKLRENYIRDKRLFK